MQESSIFSEGQFEATAARIRDLMEAQGGRIIVGIAGASSIGKSSVLAPFMYSRFAPDVCLLALDQFRLHHQDPSLYHARYRLDDPDLYRIGLCTTALAQLREGREVELPGWRHISKAENKLAAFTYLQAPAALILLEGIYAIHPDLPLDLRIYLQAPLWSRLLRRLVRNTYERKYARLEDTFSYYLQYALLAHREQVVKQRPMADWVMESTYSFRQSIQRFGLQPLERVVASGDWEASTTVAEDTDFVYIRTKHSAIFQVHYANEVYLAFPIEPAWIPLLVEMDWEEV